MGSNKTEARKQLAGALLHRLFPGQVRRDVCVCVGGGGGRGREGSVCASSDPSEG